MDPISDSAIVSALGRQLNRAVARQQVAASNLANIDTPGYRTKDVQFAEALDASLSATTADAPILADVDGLAARRDGNTVQLDRELLNMSRAAGDFSAAQTALAAKFRLVRYAINEGR
ncbi:MAG: flagellar basal body rod protein FlgB [Vicinamibacterales bacterium]